MKCLEIGLKSVCDALENAHAVGGGGAGNGAAGLVVGKRRKNRKKIQKNAQTCCA